jgi:hypothetical protein
MVGELGDQREEEILRDRFRRSRWNVTHDDSFGEAHLVRRRGVRAAGEDLDIVPERREMGGECTDVNILTARVDAAERAQRAGVFRNHRDLHESLVSGCAYQ